MKITILGTGAYGIALSKVLSDNNHEITMWTKVENEYNMLLNKGCNDKTLPNFKIDKSIKLTMNMKVAVNNAEIIFIATSVNYIKDTLEELKDCYIKKQHVCIACKGIYQDSLEFGAEMAKKILHTKNVSVISGGTFAIDMLDKNPIALTLASNDKLSLKKVKNSLEGNYLKVNTSTDVFGVEMWGAIKNIIAISCGIIDGMGCCESTKSMFIVKVINDVICMIKYFGGKEMTFLSYAGIGDLWLTCTSLTSRNYTYGHMVGSNLSKDDIDKYRENTTIEGLYTLKSLYLLLNKHNYKMLFIDIMYRILYMNEDSKIILDYLKS